MLAKRKTDCFRKAFCKCFSFFTKEYSKDLTKGRVNCSCLQNKDNSHTGTQLATSVHLIINSINQSQNICNSSDEPTNIEDSWEGWKPDITKVSHYSDQVYSVCHVHHVLEQLSSWSNFHLHHNGLLRLWMKDVTSMKHMGDDAQSRRFRKIRSVWSPARRGSPCPRHKWFSWTLTADQDRPAEMVHCTRPSGQSLSGWGPTVQRKGIKGCVNVKGLFLHRPMWRLYSLLPRPLADLSLQWLKASCTSAFCSFHCGTQFSTN